MVVLLALMLPLVVAEKFAASTASTAAATGRHGRAAPRGSDGRWRQSEFLISFWVNGGGQQRFNSSLPDAAARLAMGSGVVCAPPCIFPIDNH
jgi:hypothetical protein